MLGQHRTAATGRGRHISDGLADLHAGFTEREQLIGRPEGRAAGWEGGREAGRQGGLGWSI